MGFVSDLLLYSDITRNQYVSTLVIDRVTCFQSDLSYPTCSFVSSSLPLLFVLIAVVEDWECISSPNRSVFLN